MLHRLKALVAALLLTGLLPAFADAAVEDAKQVVQSYYSTLLGVMHKGKELGYKGRYDTLKPAVDKSFDLALMAQTTVGGFWDSMSPEQRTQLVEAFEDFTVANYAHNFDDYGGEKFETYQAQETPRKDVVVDSAIVKSDGDKVKLDYLLRAEGDGYKIIDVFVDGAISELATRRSEYTSVIRRDGVDALIKLIREKAGELAAKS